MSDNVQNKVQKHSPLDPHSASNALSCPNNEASSTQSRNPSSLVLTERAECLPERPSKSLRTISKLPRVREIILSQDREFLWNRIERHDAALGQTRGNIATPECKSCKDQPIFPFATCVVVPGLFQGQCCNCRYKGRGVCSFRQAPAPEMSPPAGKRQRISASQQPRQTILSPMPNMGAETANPGSPGATVGAEPINAGTSMPNIIDAGPSVDSPAQNSRKRPHQDDCAPHQPTIEQYNELLRCNQELQNEKEALMSCCNRLLQELINATQSLREHEALQEGIYPEPPDVEPYITGQGYVFDSARSIRGASTSLNTYSVGERVGDEEVNVDLSREADNTVADNNNNNTTAATAAMENIDPMLGQEEPSLENKDNNGR